MKWADQIGFCKWPGVFGEIASASSTPANGVPTEKSIFVLTVELDCEKYSGLGD